MTTTYALAASPKWYFLDAQGRPASGGTITTFSSLDRSTPKFVYSHSDGTFPYTDPIILDATGGSPVPMYWQFNGTDLYYVVVKDKDGNIIFDINNFPDSGGGGSGPVTNNIDIENHLINGQFLFINAVNDTDSIVTPAPVGTTPIAPGSGFFKNAAGEYVSSINSIYPSGWSFVKGGGAGATDTIKFVPTTLGVGFPSGPSANATRYFEYSFAAGPIITDAALVCIVPNVELFQNETLTISFDSNTTTSGSAAFEIVQYFGTGGSVSIPVTTSVGFSFSSAVWNRQSFQIVVPSIVGKTKGTNGDDAVFFRWVYPLNTVGAFRLANLQIQRGTFALSLYIEQTYAQDQYKVLVDLITIGNLIFPVGTLRWLSNTIGSVSFSIPGWIAIADVNETLGSSTSGAVFAGNAYKNLYIAWWNTFSNAECIVVAGRGVSALADFNANKTMTVPRGILGTALVGAGNSLFSNEPFAFLEGEKTHTLTIPEMPSHVHSSLAPNFNVAQAGLNQTSVTGGNTGITGGGLPHNNMQPTFYLWLYVKL